MSIQSIHHGPRFSTLCVASEDRLLLVATESDRQPDEEPGAMVRLLSAGASNAEGLEEGCTTKVAAELDRVLLSTPETANRPRWVFFAAALLTLEGVEYSAAGPLRVHLIKAHEVKQVSGDHVLRQDSQARIEMPPGFEDLAGDVALGNVVTRALGNASVGNSVKLPPETAWWDASAPYRVAICSDGVHMYRAPAEYLGIFHALLSAGSPAKEHAEDLIAIAGIG